MAAQENLGLMLGETARLWRNKLDQRLKPLGLSQARWLALLQMKMASQNLTQKELSERMGIEGPSLVRLLDRMEEDGWVERQVSETDRRAKTVHLTDKADAMISEIKRIAAQLRKELLKGISTEQLETTCSVLENIKQRINSFD